MFLDPLYLFVMIVGAILSGGASMWVKAATSKWQQVPIGRGLTREVAQKFSIQKGFEMFVLSEYQVDCQITMIQGPKFFVCLLIFIMGKV